LSSTSRALLPQRFHKIIPTHSGLDAMAMKG
jgi:hypothetical protein